MSQQRVLIAPDKFKGTLSAIAAAQAIARGWRGVRHDDILELLPMSDGGDGFGEVLSKLRPSRERSVKTFDAARQPCEPVWWFEPETSTAIIETAKCVGLAMLPPGRFHPFHLDTFGLGALINAAVKSGARRCIVGVGGSATNDAGIGLARALGWKFLSKDGGEIGSWPLLHRVVTVVPPPTRKLFSEMIVATDVANPLLGPDGCSRVYGPQKGLRPEDMAVAETALTGLVKAMRHIGPDFSKEPGAGAAGGLGYAFMAFCGARRVSGFEIFSKEACLKKRILAADLVITGEGAIDDQTRMGKGVGELALLCAKLKRPCYGLAGVVQPARKKKDIFTGTDSLVRLTTVEEAKAHPAEWLSKVSGELAAKSA